MSSFIGNGGEFYASVHLVPRSEVTSCLDEAGNFLGSVVNYWLENSPQCKAVSICVRIRIEKYFDRDEGEWYDYSAPDPIRTEHFHIFRCDGTIAKAVVRELCESAGWDGKLASIVNRTWQPPRLQFDM